MTEYRVRLTHVSDIGISEEVNTLTVAFAAAPSPVFLRFPLGTEKQHFFAVERAKAMRCLAPPGWRASMTLTATEDFAVWEARPDDPEEVTEGAPLFVTFTALVTTGELESATYMEMESDGVRAVWPVMKRFSPPRIRRFVTDQRPTGIFDEVTLVWHTAGFAHTRTLFPHPSAVAGRAVERTGTDTLLVTGPMNLVLRAASDTHEKQATARCFVRPEPPAIVSFTANGHADALTVHYGATVDLAGTLRGTRHAYLNEGIGRVDGVTRWRDGYPETDAAVAARPEAKQTRYTLFCLGEGVLTTKSIDVRIDDFLAVNISYYRNSGPDADGNYTYALSWAMEHCVSLAITAADQPELSGGKTTGNIRFLSKIAALALCLVATGPGGQYKKQDLLP